MRDSSLGIVEEPPFYGIELHPAGGSSVGLLTDVHGQVIHQRRRPIPGLHASGNAAAATEQGIGYQAGLSLASGMTFSYIAIRYMLEAAGRPANPSGVRPVGQTTPDPSPARLAPPTP